MPASSAPAAHTRPEARYPLAPITVGLLFVSLCLFGFGAFRHLTAKLPETAPKAVPAAHGKTHTAGRPKAAAKAAPAAAPMPDDLAFQTMLAGGVGLLLAALSALGLNRTIQATQYRTMQSILEVERAAWEKKRSLMDAERDQLSARLQETQQSKDEIDSLRHHASRQFQEFFRTLPVACFCFAADGKIVRWNEAAEKLYGIRADEALAGTLWNTVVPLEEREAMEGRIRRVLAGEVLLDEERRDQRCGGATALVRFSMVPLYDAASGIVGGLSAGIDITRTHHSAQQAAEASQALGEARAALQAAQAEALSEREEAERLRALLSGQPVLTPAALTPTAPPVPSPDSTRDAVTGLCSHRAFHERLREEAERAHRYNTPLSLLALDLDNFTGYNAACGYAAGDLALKTAAEVIGSKLRTVDVATRFSADSFAVILPETGEAGARVAAERLRSGIAGAGWTGHPLTASCGFALLTPDVPDADTLLTRALDALTRAQSLGPGTLVQSGDTPAKKPTTRRLKKEKVA